ncbi:hypothetical protein BX592_111251 [Paraburkholderia rhizosphaerae]|uniref:SET domain-containing protein n=1 Tax=Paraburkholderia rhizosphaerae TaxID=480658 RepID=A0A4R8LPZ8_9BURK|nr:hypothetical protein BX592_111251 [Paraburkholderia rhizosphaerae]
MHGKGVFALRPIRAGERVLEYKGEVTTWRRAAARLRRAGAVGHTFVFGLSSGRVIDGSCGGNSARWLNHACDANCEAIEEHGRIFIHARTDIAAGAELFIEYGLSVDEPLSPEVISQYQCRCGALSCSTSMLAGVTRSTWTTNGFTAPLNT